MRKTVLSSLIFGCLFSFISCSKTETPLVEMINVPGKDFMIGKTEVTQAQYFIVTGENPSYFKSSNSDNKSLPWYDGINFEQYERVTGEAAVLFDSADRPVENVSFYDAVYFCNMLSLKEGLTPVYSVGGYTNPIMWGYTLNKTGSSNHNLYGKIEYNKKANGYRLPEYEEWLHAARGGDPNNRYSGSYYLNNVGWYDNNSYRTTHDAAQKSSNNYGIYDMSGNVFEFCWDQPEDEVGVRYAVGGCFSFSAEYCEIENHYKASESGQTEVLGFRVARNKK